jgi:hypothetical protein
MMKLSFPKSFKLLDLKKMGKLMATLPNKKNISKV